VIGCSLGSCGLEFRFSMYFNRGSPSTLPWRRVASTLFVAFSRTTAVRAAVRTQDTFVLHSGGFGTVSACSMRWIGPHCSGCEVARPRGIGDDANASTCTSDALGLLKCPALVSGPERASSRSTSLGGPIRDRSGYDRPRNEPAHLISRELPR